MTSLPELVTERLAEHDVSLQDWHSLIQRLLDYGVMCRDESLVEAELYDRFVRLESLVDDTLALLGIRMHHDTRFNYVRLIPPGARVPGIDDEQDTPFNGGLRTRLNQHEVAVLLALRAEYDKALREGQIDEQGCATLSVEALMLSMKNLLNRQLPENQTERRLLFKRLRQLRVIRLPAEADVLAIDIWFKLRPMIVTMVDAQWLGQLQQTLMAALPENSQELAAELATEYMPELAPEDRSEPTPAAKIASRKNTDSKSQQAAPLDKKTRKKAGQEVSDTDEISTEPTADSQSLFDH